jgi:hypothetical protein
MTQVEFKTFIARLFANYPSLADRLERLKLPDGVSTGSVLAVWFTRLEKFSLLEMLTVLNDWNARGTQPWDSYAIEQAIAVIYSTAQKRRDKQARSEESEAIMKAARKPRAAGGMETFADGILKMMKGSMVGAYAELRPLHAKMLAGEMTESEYYSTQRRVLDAM